MRFAAPRSTFRDPAGSLRLEGDRAVRVIHEAAREQALEFVTSPFYTRLQQRGDIVGATIEESPAGLRLLHPRIAVPTYPWEWTPSQWLAAADLTLTLCGEALDEGWVLKDATPLNILFVGPRPVLVDVLSFERHDPLRRSPEASIWLPYGQYMRTFVLPLLMNRLLNWPLTLSLFHRDGYEPATLYSALSWWQRLSPAAFWSITLPRLLGRREAEAASAKPAASSQAAKPARKPELTLHILKSRLSSLRKQTHRAMPSQGTSDWRQYKDSLSHYSAQASAQKLEWVRQVLEELRSEEWRVLDIGANTGEFSALAAGMGAEVVALERDAAAAEQLYRISQEGDQGRSQSILTVNADLARPSPAVGWENAEASALLDRLEGRSDLVLMLAVIHHLLLMEQIPLPGILELCHRLTRRRLVIEWVPVSDPMYQSLMRGRDSLYGSLTEADLLAACAGRFAVMRRLALDNGRILFLFEKQAGSDRRQPGEKGQEQPNE
jgi:SAM-dependent methyltransferase